VNWIQSMILCGFRFLGRNLFHHYKRFFHTFKMKRIIVAPCFILVHRPNLLLWVHLNALWEIIAEFEIVAE